jgi:hypothetical protein
MAGLTVLPKVSTAAIGDRPQARCGGNRILFFIMTSWTFQFVLVMFLHCLLKE